MEMVAEGNKLIAEDEARKTQAPPAPVQAPQEKSQSDNPYFQARMKILEKYPEWRRNEVKRMEKEGNLSNRFYDDFVSQVRELGDKLSS